MKFRYLCICFLILLGCGQSANDEGHNGKIEQYTNSDNDKGKIMLTLNPDKTFNLTIEYWSLPQEQPKKDSIQGTWAVNITLLTLTTADNSTIVYELAATPFVRGDNEIKVLTYVFKANSKGSFATGINLFEKEQADKFLDSLEKRYTFKSPVLSDNSVALPLESLAGQFYGYAPEFDRWECETFGECDCCESSLLFINDSVFAAVDYCMGNDYYFKGSYERIDNVIHFYSDSIRIIREWDEEAEVDTTDTVLPYHFIKKTETRPFNFTWTRFDCKGSICFNTDIKGSPFATPVDRLQTRFMDDIKEDSILVKLMED